MVCIKDVVLKHRNLGAEWRKQNKDMKKCGIMLDDMKLSLTELMFLPTIENHATKQELTIARDTLEIGAKYSVAMGDTTSFERYMSQLKTYYMDYKKSSAGSLESPHMYELLGMNLLHLLAQNRVAEFHTELELLPSDIILNNVYIRCPVSLEQYIMEGSYNKVLLARGNLPSEYYGTFIDILVNTIRSEIGDCMESAYNRISLPECGKILNLSLENDVISFIKKKNWELSNDGFVTLNGSRRLGETEISLPGIELAKMVITYAKEMEQIV